MLKIVLLAKKGGVGKSTLSLLLHESLHHAGKTVAIRDWDAQGSSSKALHFLQKNPAKVGEIYDVLLYDTPPSLEHLATTSAIQDADIALIITTPSPVDIWEASEAAQYAISKNPNAIVRVVFNKVKKSTVLGKLIEDAAKQMPAPTLPMMISAKECYQHTFAKGWKALDTASREEVLQWTIAILGLRH